MYPFNCLSWSILTQMKNMDTQLLIADGVQEFFFFPVYDIYMPFYFYIYLTLLELVLKLIIRF